MSRRGSVGPEKDAVHPLLAVAAVGLGVMSMIVGVAVGGRAGLHAGLILAETLLILPGLVGLALSGVPLRSGLALHPVRARTALLALAAGAALWAASLGLMNVQFVMWRPPQEFLETFQQLHKALQPKSAAGALLSVAAIALAPAICEEVLFRGVVLPAMCRLGAGFGLVASSALFALIHIDATTAGLAFHRLPFAFVVGLGLGSLRLFTGSLLPAIAAHAVINTITFSTVLFTGAASEAVDEPHLGLGLALLVGGGAATAVLLRATRRATLAA
jgi:membrane protease YdiL (CAAX protease family)